MNPLQVVAGIIYDQAGKILIAQRSKKDEQYKLWEFPGGKLEAGESFSDALNRELMEEFGILVSEAKAFCVVHKKYPKNLSLHVYTVRILSAITKKESHLDIRWVTLAEIGEFDFCEADKEVIQLLINQTLVPSKD